MSTPDIPTRLEVAALRDRLADAGPPRLLDVREPAEFEAMHIPGAYNVPPHLLREHRGELRAHPGRVVLVRCRSLTSAAELGKAS